MTAKGHLRTPSIRHTGSPRSRATITIRDALPSDTAALDDLLRRSWLDNWAAHVSPASVARFHAEDPVAAYVETRLLEFRVALLDDRLAGMFHLEDGMLHAIHVLGSMQGSGVGSALMADAEASGARRLEVRAFNVRAYRFYLKRGWRETRRYMADEIDTPAETIELVCG